ncbi:hypothetical protein DL768_011167 [Monosporascus sp. mg162]|nr:hypothetical protein DL768_011167 [Monosporascus sp. mg162]
MRNITTERGRLQFYRTAPAEGPRYRPLLAITTGSAPLTGTAPPTAALVKRKADDVLARSATATTFAVGPVQGLVRQGYPRTLDELLSEANALPYADEHRNYTKLPYNPQRNVVDIEQPLRILRRIGDAGRKAIEPLGHMYGHAIGRKLRIPNFRVHELGQPAAETPKQVEQRAVYARRRFVVARRQFCIDGSHIFFTAEPDHMAKYLLDIGAGDAATHRIKESLSSAVLLPELSFAYDTIKYLGFGFKVRKLKRFVRKRPAESYPVPSRAFRLLMYQFLPEGKGKARIRKSRQVRKRVTFQAETVSRKYGSTTAGT